MISVISMLTVIFLLLELLHVANIPTSKHKHEFLDHEFIFANASSSLLDLGFVAPTSNSNNVEVPVAEESILHSMHSSGVTLSLNYLGAFALLPVLYLL